MTDLHVISNKSHHAIYLNNRIVAELYIDYEGDLVGIVHIDSFKEPKLYSDVQTIVRQTMQLISHG